MVKNEPITFQFIPHDTSMGTEIMVINDLTKDCYWYLTYSRVLTQEEIASLYELQKDKFNNYVDYSFSVHYIDNR